MTDRTFSKISFIGRTIAGKLGQIGLCLVGGISSNDTGPLPFYVESKATPFIVFQSSNDKLVRATSDFSTYLASLLKKKILF